MSIINYLDYQDGSDENSDKIKKKMTSFVFLGNFPIDLDPNMNDEEDITDEILKEIVRVVHGSGSKTVVLAKLVTRFKNISKNLLKNKIEDISLTGLIVDPDIYFSNVAFNLCRKVPHNSITRTLIDCLIIEE